MTEQQKSGYAYIQNTSKLLQNPNQNPQRDDLVQFSFENRREEILQLNEMEDDSLGSLSEVESQCNLKEKLHGSDEQFDTSPVQTKRKFIINLKFKKQLTRIIFELNENGQRSQIIIESN